MSSPALNLIGTLGDTSTQGLGRLISQYVRSPKLVALLTGIYSLGQDLDNLCQRVGRLLSLTDNIYYTPDGGTTYPVNTNGASNDQLRIIAQFVGVTKYLPDGTTLTDAQLLQLVKLKIFRNSAVANSYGLRMTLWGIFDPTNFNALLAGGASASPINMITNDVGSMGIWATLIYPGTTGYVQPSAVQLSELRIPAGRSNLPYGLIARPCGVALTFSWQPNTGVFSFSDAFHNPGTPLTPNGVGFNVTTGGTNGTWAQAFW